jgi:hypothetical protein
VGAICKIIAQKRKETVAINVEMVDKILNSHNVNE